MQGSYITIWAGGKPYNKGVVRIWGIVTLGSDKGKLQTPSLATGKKTKKTPSQASYQYTFFFNIYENLLNVEWVQSWGDASLYLHQHKNIPEQADLEISSITKRKYIFKNKFK